MVDKRSEKERRAADERRSDSGRRLKVVSIELDRRSDDERRLDGNRRMGIDRRQLGDIFTEES